MPRFFLPPEIAIPLGEALPSEILLEGEDAFHLSVSLRARVGDEVTLCTAQGVEVLCTVKAICGGKKAPVVTLSPERAAQGEQESPLEITLYQALPKGKKTDSILQKCTELGVSRVVFVNSDRSIPEGGEDGKKMERYRRIAKEAAMQCGRGKLVEVDFLCDTDSAIAQMCNSDLSFFCYEEEREGGLKALLQKGTFQTLSFFIGPEGGISPRERDLFLAAKIPPVTLGKRILRTETAASAVLSMILYEKEL